MSGASAVIHKQKRYIKLFNRYGATSKEHSITLEEIGIRRSYVFNRMVNRGVFIECERGSFYIDNEAAIRFRQNIRKRAIVAFTLMMIFVAIYYLIGIK